MSFIVSWNNFCKGLPNVVGLVETAIGWSRGTGEGTIGKEGWEGVSG